MGSDHIEGLEAGKGQDDDAAFLHCTRVIESAHGVNDTFPTNPAINRPPVPDSGLGGGPLRCRLIVGTCEAHPPMRGVDMAESDAAALTEGVHRIMPLAGTLGLEMLTNRAEEVSARLAWSPSLCTSGEIMHGGAIMALADSTGGLCAFNNLPDGASGTSTIESKTNFCAPCVRTTSKQCRSRSMSGGPSLWWRQMSGDRTAPWWRG